MCSRGAHHHICKHDNAEQQPIGGMMAYVCFFIWQVLGSCMFCEQTPDVLTEDDTLHVMLQMPNCCLPAARSCLLLYVMRLAGWLKHCNLSFS